MHIVNCAHCAGLVDPAGRCQMAASSTTTGNNCQCHSACKDDNDDDAGGNHQMMMMIGRGTWERSCRNQFANYLSRYLVCHAQRRQKYF